MTAKNKDMLKSLLTKDIGWKILSLAIAIALWLFVINSENPIESRSYSVPIELTNAEAVTAQNLVLTNYDDYKNSSVTIKLKGARLSLDNLSQNKTLISASVDLSGIKAGENSLPVLTDIPNALELESVSPSSIPLAAEYSSAETVEITPELIGQTASGYLALTPELSQNTATVSGPESEMALLSSLRLPINISGLNKTTTIEASPKACDSSGNELSGLKVSVSAVGVVIPVTPYKEVPVIVETQGVPYAGYSFKIDYTPKNIELIGDKATLDAISSIDVPVISLDERSASFERNFSVLSLIDGDVSTRYASDSTITVTVSIEHPIERTLHYTEEQVSMTGSPLDGHTASFEAIESSLTVTGPDYAVAAIDEGSLSASFDITDLSAGEHIKVLNFSLPEGVSITGTMPTVKVTVSQSE